MVDEQRPSDIVETAFQNMRSTQVPQGPSAQALEQTLQAVGQAQREPARVSLMERIRNMNKFVKYPVAASLVLAVAAAFAYLMLVRHTEVAFADVRQQIEQAQTMTLTATAQMKGMDKPMTMKMYFKSPGLMRQEMTMDPLAFLPSGTSRPATMPAVLTTVSIFDMPHQKGLALIPSQKKAITFEFTNMPADMVAKTKDQNVLDKLKKAVAGEHQDLGEKKINGVQAKGYRCKEDEMPSVVMDIWVDASSGKPLVVEETMTEPMAMKVTMTDFVVNPKLDDSLFDTKVPEGYSTESQVVDLNVTEAELIKGLSALAKVCGGVFPKSLVPTPELIKQLQDPVKAPKLSEKEGKEFGMQLQRVMFFQIKTMQGGEFVYVGEGVTLGDKTTPVLWYKAKGDKTYTIIYGDLHTEHAESAPKRPASQPASGPASQPATRN